MTGNPPENSILSTKKRPLTLWDSGRAVFLLPRKQKGNLSVVLPLLAGPGKYKHSRALRTPCGHSRTGRRMNDAREIRQGEELRRRNEFARRSVLKNTSPFWSGLALENSGERSSHQEGSSWRLCQRGTTEFWSRGVLGSIQSQPWEQ